jgi:hypothetical protein
MKKQRVIKIKGTDFIVDVTKHQLSEKADPTNTIAYKDMRDTGNGYAFDYSAKNKNLSDLFDNESTTIKIPKFILVEPIGYAEKYNYSVDDFKDKSDFEIIVDQQAFDLRIKKGILPTIDICGHTFYVDIRMDKLRPKDDFLSKGIAFSDIERYYNLEKRTYTIPYNPSTREFQEPDYLNLKEPPKDLIAVRFPSERLLDRIGWNRRYRFEITHGLIRNGLKLQFTAKNVPWEKTFLVDLIKSNLKAEMNQERDAQKLPPYPTLEKKGRTI